jgi:voltage-gated potassium channel
MTERSQLSPKEKHERWRVLRQLEDWLETPMVVLSFVWLLLVMIELMWTTSGVFELLVLRSGSSS